jgi:hypothetical protein
MFGQLAFECAGAVAPDEDVVDGVFAVVLVAALAATAPPKINAPVTAVAATIFRM